MARKLKVFRTPIGFHDAYVAAPSKIAALKAWGTDKDLFARGGAELVTDPKLTKEPLESPGVVFKRSRGTAAEQIAALPNEDWPLAKNTPRAPAPQPARKIGPRPDRTALTEAEENIAQAHKRLSGETSVIDDKIAGLQRQRQSLIKKLGAEVAKLEKRKDALAKTYQRALDNWRE